MSRSLFGFVKEREPVRPEVVAAEFLSLADTNGDARPRIEKIIGGDPRFLWEGEYLRTMDASQLSLDEAPFVVFDLETTGTSAKEGGVTEFGAVKVYKGEVVEEFSTLVNPEAPIFPFVIRLTGITNDMVADAPTISEVLPRFEEFVEGSVLVAHNSPFDCSFVTAARGGKRLPNPVLDTLKLARILIPGLPRYRLSSLAAHLGIRQMPNHRALSDASATAGVLVKLLPMLEEASVRTVGEATSLRGGKKERPRAKKKHLADGVPNTPGVYYFVNKHGAVLYVGKAKCLKARVRSYFNGGDGRRKIGRLVRETVKVEYRETETELHALILEAREIRRLLPRFNSAGRGDRPGWFIKLDVREAYPVPVRVPEGEDADGAILLGPYRSAGVLDACIEALGRIFPLRRCSGGGEPCLYGQMGRCAPCVGMGAEEYEAEVVEGIATLLRGEGGEEHLARLLVERDRLAKELEFEAAARLRDLISGIERIRLVKTLASAEGLQAVVAPSTEEGMIEVFVLSEGRLVAHRGFASDDEEGVSGFAEEVLAGHRGEGAGVKNGADEARVVAAYLKRRSGVVEAARMRDAADLVAVARKVSGAVEAEGSEGSVEGGAKL
ncbi:MAG: DEDD exonuclease domain-containing protein [Rubrobacter sp.]|nr:DEDD exonuclease domain-containing protein [Rubrobacter sp.]